MINLANLLASDRGDETVVAHYFGEPYNLGEFRAAVWQQLEQLQTVPGRDLVLALEDPLRFLVAVFAGLHAGRCLILPPNLQSATLDDYAKKTAQLLRDGDVELRPDDGGPQAPVAFRDLDPQSAVFHFFTSGSTGTPKLIEKRLAQIEAEIEVLQRYWGAKLGDAAIMSTVSPRHIYGLLFYVLWPLSAGRRFFVPGYDYWERLVAELPENVAVISSPAHLGRFPKHLDRAGLNSPRMVFSSGEPLPFDAAQTCRERLGVLPTEIFGSTETGGIAERQQSRPDSPWRPFDIVQIAVDDNDCLKIKSPYLGGPDWYQTEDRVAIAAQGAFQMLGRADRMIKIAGKRLDLNELERALMAVDWVHEAAVTPITGTAGRLGAVVVLNEAGSAELQRHGAFRFNRMIRRHLSRQFELTSLPQLWRFQKTLPRNAQGKISRLDLANLFSD